MIIVDKPSVTYSSIVEIGEEINRLELNTKEKYLKLHRGVMDVSTIDLNSILKDFDFNTKSIQQYGPNNGDTQLISTIKTKFNIPDHDVLITPGGMAALDLVINTIYNKTFVLPKYHWGSWNKILKTHNKEIESFDDFNLQNVKLNKNNVYMLCVPSNPTGWSPDVKTLKDFIERSKKEEVTLILDLPYYHLFNSENDKIFESFHDNIILVSSFSKSLGLSGFRVGYVATKNKNLHEAMRIRSLYKYNSISTLPQQIIEKILTSEIGELTLNEYKTKTKNCIKKNIDYLDYRNFLFQEYPSKPVGPFCIVNLEYDFLLKNRVSSVPLNKFSLVKEISNKYSRISVAVDHETFVNYFNKI